jgi:hypothetical protein
VAYSNARPNFVAPRVGFAGREMVAGCRCPLGRADLSPMARSFWDDNKRVSNARTKRELGVGLRYPDYRRRLRAILDSGG